MYSLLHYIGLHINSGWICQAETYRHIIVFWICVQNVTFWRERRDHRWIFPCNGSFRARSPDVAEETARFCVRHCGQG